MKPRKVTIFWTEPSTDDPYQVRCLVTPGYPGDRNEPASGPEVEILYATDERGQDRPDVVALLKNDFFDEIEAAAVTDAAECDLEDWEDAQERHGRLRGVLSDITGIPVRGRA